MEDLNIENQAKIIENLNDIDQLCAEGNLTHNEAMRLYPKFIETLTWVDEHLRSIDGDIALQLLEFLKHFHEVS